jgi:hypothetical protein
MRGWKDDRELRYREGRRQEEKRKGREKKQGGKSTGRENYRE